MLALRQSNSEREGLHPLGHLAEVGSAYQAGVPWSQSWRANTSSVPEQLGEFGKLVKPFLSLSIKWADSTYSGTLRIK